MKIINLYQLIYQAAPSSAAKPTKLEAFKKPPGFKTFLCLDDKDLRIFFLKKMSLKHEAIARIFADLPEKWAGYRKREKNKFFRTCRAWHRKRDENQNIFHGENFFQIIFFPLTNNY